MIRISALSTFFMLAIATAVSPAYALEEADKPKIEQIIRDYLLSNPELLLEVQQAYEKKQKAAAQDRAQRTLVENREVIFNSEHQGVIGNPNGDVTVVEFFDYNCSFCQRAMADMNNLLEADKNLKFVLKELPILSEGSVEASRISTAVYRLFPEKYEAFHNNLLGLAGQKDGNRALRVAQDMNLDIDALNAEAKKPEILGAFREANELSSALGMNGTPSYVIGDEVLFGALGADILRQKIENVRKCGKSECS